MEEERARYLSIQICEKLRNTSPVSSEFSIFKVPDHLRQVNEKAYEPQVVSIGPYHRGKAHLQGMEVYKMQYLKLIVKERSGNAKNAQEAELKRFVMAMGALEERARKCYEEKFNTLDSDDFVEMMILDGCFILEYMRGLNVNLRKKDEPAFVVTLKECSIQRDLFLLENQLPFFVLIELFRLAKALEQRDDYFIHSITPYLKAKFPGLHVSEEYLDPSKSIHLLDMVHNCWLPLNRRSASDEGEEESRFIQCATELIEAGIKFRKVDDGCQRSFFDIRFKHGTLEIPTFHIDDETETFLRNMIAYEQLRLANEVCYVTDYIIFMDRLIGCRKDVQLLCRCGIVNSDIGDDEVIAALFNKLARYVAPSYPGFLYSELFKKVNKHCSKKHNIWLATLRHHYFNTPWAMISFFAAVALLLLTFTQTLYSVFAYYHTLSDKK